MIAQLAGLSATSVVLEPSGGDGAFVQGLVQTGKVPADRIEVWDIDPACRAPIEALGATFVPRDGLLGEDVRDRFSHVVGNPPYLNKQSAYIRGNRKALQSRFRAVGANDTYAMFTYQSVRALRPGGQLVFLISDTFLTLGIHRKLREHLLATTTIESVTLLPSTVFHDASVNTAIVSLRKSTPASTHQVKFFDLRTRAPGDYHSTPSARVDQSELAANHASVFAFDPRERAALVSVGRGPRLLDLVDGGLGMYTKDNRRFLGRIDYGAGASGTLPAVPLAAVDGTAWVPYHKRGGVSRWWAPAEHCVRWDEASRRGYGMPGTALAGRDAAGNPRPGFIVSGVSSRLSARLITPGAMWESNKAFGFFPKDPSVWPPEFFVAILNSQWYDRLANSLNHTVSLQIRDLKALPLLPFTPSERKQLAVLARRAISLVQRGQDPETVERAIEVIVTAAATRPVEDGSPAA